MIERLGLDSDVRLACQLKPSKNLSVIPLINPETKEIKTRTAVGLSGKEKETVVVFIDLREFTKLSDLGSLPVLSKKVWKYNSALGYIYLLIKKILFFLKSKDKS